MNIAEITVSSPLKVTIIIPENLVQKLGLGIFPSNLQVASALNELLNEENGKKISVLKTTSYPWLAKIEGKFLDSDLFDTLHVIDGMLTCFHINSQSIYIETHQGKMPSKILKTIMECLQTAWLNLDNEITSKIKKGTPVGLVIRETKSIDEVVLAIGKTKKEDRELVFYDELVTKMIVDGQEIDRQELKPEDLIFFSPSNHAIVIEKIATNMNIKANGDQELLIEGAIKAFGEIAKFNQLS